MYIVSIVLLQCIKYMYEVLFESYLDDAEISVAFIASAFKCQILKIKLIPQ